MQKVKKWNLKSLKAEALKYETKKEFKQKSPAAYRAATIQGCLTKISVHLTSKIKKRTIKDLNDAAKMKGGICLDKTYKGIDKKHSFKCKRGHVWQTQAKLILDSGSWCNTCLILEKNQSTVSGLIKKLKSLQQKYGRRPTKREFDEHSNNLNSSTVAHHFATWNNFLKLNGIEPTKGLFGNTWRNWEGLVGELIKLEYPGEQIYPQYFDRKTRTIVDYYLPNLNLAIDAKTSNYDIEPRTAQLNKLKNRYTKLILYCLNEDISQQRLKGVEYVFANSLIKKYRYRKIVKDIVKVQSLTNEYRGENGLITKQLVTKQISVLSKELGRTPRMREFLKDPRFVSSFEGRGLYKSWNEAVKSAGLKPRKFHQIDVTKFDCELQWINLYKSLKITLKRPPTTKELMKATNNPSIISYKTLRVKLKMTIKEFFESKNLPLYRHPQAPRYSDEDLDQLCDSVGLKWIGGKNSKTNDKILVKCKEHNISKEIMIEKVKSVKAPCKICKSEKARTKYQLSKDDINKTLRKLNLTKVDDKSYVNAHQMLNLKCSKCSRQIQQNMARLRTAKKVCCK